ncbi:hypothetical protein BGX28_006391 [Mortierella sp. GBA30]|nr:hypothetical protein BGX28_006391 [Mortierella sp. GBA30]
MAASCAGKIPVAGYGVSSERGGEEIWEQFEDEVVSIGELDGEVLGEDVAENDEADEEDRDERDVERFANEKGCSERELGGKEDEVVESDGSRGESEGASTLGDADMSIGVGMAVVVLVGIATGRVGGDVSGAGVRTGGPDRTSMGAGIGVWAYAAASGATVRDRIGGDEGWGIDEMGGVDAREVDIDVGPASGLDPIALGPAKGGGANGPVESVSIFENVRGVDLKVVRGDSRLGFGGSKEERAGNDGDEAGAVWAVMVFLG